VTVIGEGDQAVVPGNRVGDSGDDVENSIYSVIFPLFAGCVRQFCGTKQRAEIRRQPVALTDPDQFAENISIRYKNRGWCA